VPHPRAQQHLSRGRARPSAGTMAPVTSAIPAGEAMLLLPGGAFHMGSERFYPEEAPVREVEVGAFRIDRTPVTNRQFAAFVAATGHVTLAERPIDPTAPHGTDPRLLKP